MSVDISMTVERKRYYAEHDTAAVQRVPLTETWSVQSQVTGISLHNIPDEEKADRLALELLVMTRPVAETQKALGKKEDALERWASEVRKAIDEEPI